MSTPLTFRYRWVGIREAAVRRSGGRPLVVVGLVVLAMVLGGCDGFDWDEMADQPRYEPYEAVALQEKGTAKQKPPLGTVSRTPTPDYEQSKPERITLELLKRGRERFNIYCSVCHGEAGYGNGPVVRQGFPRPPSYHTKRLRQASDRYLYKVITQGLGKMPEYRYEVPPPDRHAVIAYIQALQLSQHAEVSRLSPQMQRQLTDAPGQTRSPLTQPSNKTGGVKESAP